MNQALSSLEEMRKAIDCIDTELVRLFEARMRVSHEIACYKQAQHLQVLDAGREETVLKSRAAMVSDPSLIPAVIRLFTCIMSLSREAQHQVLNAERPPETVD